MKRYALAAVFVLAALPLFAADWPAAFERYESIALESPNRSGAMWQMWKYAVATGRVDELKQRWESKKVGTTGRPHRLLLAFFAELENDFEAARTNFDQAIEAAPNDASGWLLRGQMETGRRMPEARTTLEKALELERAQGGAGTAAETLAEDHLASGRVEEARAVLDRAVATPRAPEDWLRLTLKRAETALAQGRLGELIAQVGAAPSGPFGGSETAQAYLAAQDYAQASAELARERKGRPQDALLRRQALTVARAANRTSEIARLLREETNLAPTPEKWRELFRALLANDSAEEARAVLAEQGAALFAEPRTWRDRVPELWQLELARPAAEVLAKAAGEGNWEAALLRAELLIAEKEWAPAEEALWSVLDPKSEAQPLAAGSRVWAGLPPPFLQVAAMPGVHPAERIRRLTEYLNRTPAPFNPRLTMTIDRTTTIETLHDARDLAVLYLAMIAAETQRAPAFLTRLAQGIAGWSRAERILAWLIVQNPANALAEMAGSASETRDSEFEKFCQNQLTIIRRLPLKPELAERAAALADKFPGGRAGPRVVRTSLDYGGRFREANKVFREARFDEAWKIFGETSAAFRASGSPVVEREVMACAMSFAFLLPEVRGDAERKAEGAALALRSAYPRKRSPRWPTSSEGSQALFPTEVPAWYYRFFERGTGEPLRPSQLPEAQRGKLVYPPRTIFTWEQTGVLWTVFGRTRQTPIWPLLKNRLDAQATELSGDEAFFARTAAAYFAWWNQEPADAIARMQQLLTETGDPGLRLGLAAMLRQNVDSATASQVLAELKPPTPAYARTITNWRLRLVTETREAAAAAVMAREFADAPWEVADLRALLPVLEKAGCTEAVAALRPRLQAEALREEDSAWLPAALHDLESPATRVDGVAMAKRILATAPSRGRSTALTAARAAALQTLKNLGESEAHFAQLTRATAETPENTEAWERLAEASGESEAAAAWRKVLALQPDHRVALRELLKTAATGSEEQRQTLEEFLAVEPDDLVLQRSNLLFSEYEKAGQLPRLAEAIAKAPFRQSGGWRSGPQRSSNWRDRAQLFIEAHQPEAALTVLRKALTIFDPVPSDLRRMLLQQLVTLDRREEAGRELIECLAPGPAWSATLFAWRGAADITEPPPTVDAVLLGMAQSLGVARDLRARLQEAATRDATARVVLIFLQVADREPAVLPKILALIPQLTPRGGDMTWVLPLATELAAWPEAAEGCRALLAAYDRALEETKSYSATRRLAVARVLARVGGKAEAARQARGVLETARQDFGSADEQKVPGAVGEIALAAGDATLLRECSSAYVEVISMHNKRNRFVETSEPLKFAGDLLDAGHAPEAQQILAALRAVAAVQDNSGLNLHLDAFEMEAELRRGEWRLATPVVWLDAGRTTPEQATLVWDLGILSRASGGAPQPVIRGEAAPALDGRLTVELFAGEDAESMQPVARITGASSRGVWQGTLPAVAGFLRAVIYEGERVLFGEALVVCAGRNLAREGEAAQPGAGLPAGEAQTVKGGPGMEGEYVSFRPADPNGRRSNSLPAGPRVRIQPGRDYLLSGWVRTIGNRSARLGWRCLNREGKSVSQGTISTYSAGGRFWTRSTQRLSWPRNDAQGERMPTTTVFIEPVIEGGGAFDLADLSLVEIPIAPTAKSP